MTDTQQAPTEASSAAAPAASTSIEERVDALKQSLTPVGEDSDYTEQLPPKPKAKEDDDAKPEKAEAKDESPEALAKAERLARREALRQREAQRKERDEYFKARKAQQPPQPQEDTAALQAEVQRLKKNEAAMRDPAHFIEAAMGVGVDPAEIINYVNRAVNDPSAIAADVAAKRAKEVVSPELEAMKAEVAAIKRAHEEQIQQARIAQERAAEAEFIAHAAKQGEASAISAWREAFGDQQLITLANHLVKELPEGSTMEDLLDVVEERCDSIIQRLSRPAKQPKKPEHPAQKNISARARADRTEIDDPEAAMASLSVDERFRLLATQLNNSR